jgi:glycosyltransferase involved in cell wall biosynthesis
MKSLVPELLVTRMLQSTVCEISVVMPCFNQQAIIDEVLTQLVSSIESNFELIIIDDASTDETLERIKIFSSGNFENTKLTSLKVYSNPRSGFETYCDFFGFENANGEFLLEIQADMFIRDPGFDLRMIAALKRNQDVFALSGRGTHKISEVVSAYHKSLGTDRAYSSNLLFFAIGILLRRLIGKWRKVFSIKRNSKVDKVQSESNTLQYNSRIIFPDILEFESAGRAGLLGDLIEKSDLSFGLIPRKLFLGETIMRGPLMIRAEVYREIGGLNVKSFYQGFDDHELMLQAWSSLGKRCGYIPVNVYSILSQGTTRKPKSLKSEFQIFVRTYKIAFNRRNTQLYKLSHGEEFKLPKVEIRDY